MNANEQYFYGPLLWIGISLGIIFAILFYIPYPLSIILAIASFILLNFYFRKKVIQRVNTKFGSASRYSSPSLSTILALIVEQRIMNLLVPNVVQR